ncbi:MAG: penicillin-binding protein activator LpoB [bacterium]
MRIRLAVATFAVVGVALGGCTKQVSYGNPEQVETLTPEFGSTDLQMIASKMVQSLLASPVITSKPKPPLLYVATVKNKTDEHIDTQSITDKISTTLIQSGKVQFTAMADIPKELVDQLEYQNKSGLVDPTTAKPVGKHVGADYMLTGEITSIVKKSGSTKDYYYKITLKLANIQTAVIEWQDEKEIRKGETKSLFGS